jgi:hypothetical protein
LDSVTRLNNSFSSNQLNLRGGGANFSPPCLSLEDCDER